MKIFSRMFQITLYVSLLASLSSTLWAGGAPAFKVFGSDTSVDQVREKNKDKFYEQEMQTYNLVKGAAEEEFLRQYWEQDGKKAKKNAEQAKTEYMKQHVKVSDSEVKEMLKKYENHPNLKDLSAKEKQEQIRGFLQQKGESAVIQNILDEGYQSKHLQVLVSQPKAPLYDVKVGKTDHVRFGPGEADVEPSKGGCSGDDCKITIIEYSEFQCPFCSRVLPAAKQVLDKYKGQIRWITRDFPLSFHPRARPAAIAAKCAAKQGKYWDMYYALFDNQQKLNDVDFKQHAEKIKLDTKQFAACVANPPKEIEETIDANLSSGLSYGVSGTPAYLINGQRYSGALPPEEFQRIIEELSKKS